jgi:hypothetical protein
MNKITLRPAIAMIELIFAIVIIGIVLMSAPMLISTASKSGYVAIQQEGINEAATKVNMIMGYHWDEWSADELFLDPILGVSSAGHNDLNESGTTGRRIGTPKESYRSFVRSDGTDDLNASTTLGFDGTESEDDMDDFQGASTLFFTGETSTNEYVETTTINISTAISYSTDTLVSGGYNQSDITNIKSIITTLSSSSGIDELNKTIILRAFSCNIGGYKLEEKDVN